MNKFIALGKISAIQFPTNTFTITFECIYKYDFWGVFADELCEHIYEYILYIHPSSIAIDL